MPGLEVWFQRASDVVRKLMYGDVDLGIVGYDMFDEIANGDSGLIVLHDALGFGKCHLGLGIPTGGKWVDINSIDELRRCELTALNFVGSALLESMVDVPLYLHWTAYGHLCPWAGRCAYIVH